MMKGISITLRGWILRQVSIGALTRPGAQWRFARRLALRVAIGAVAIDFLSRLALGHLGLVPRPAFPGFIYDSILTLVSATSLSLFFGLAIGKAIVDLTITRTEFERLSRTDTLSGLLNRRAFTDRLASAAPTAMLAIFDIDHFKSINDRFGHPVGDRVITTVAATISEAFAGAHTVARIGGEEFGVVIEGLSEAEAVAVVEAARAAVAALSIPVGGGALSPTVSAGVAAFSRGRPSEAVFAAADRALYLAKAAGRNTVVREDDFVALFERRTSPADAELPLSTAKLRRLPR